MFANFNKAVNITEKQIENLNRCLEKAIILNYQ